MEQLLILYFQQTCGLIPQQLHLLFYYLLLVTLPNTQQPPYTESKIQSDN